MEEGESTETRRFAAKSIQKWNTPKKNTCTKDVEKQKSYSYLLGHSEPGHDKVARETQDGCCGHVEENP